jgi:iron complex outermembrane receptor protein
VILGSAGNSAAGSREVTAYSAELVMPITRMLEGTLAVRHEKYSDYGKDTSPKASIRFQPTNNLLLRASVGEGFSAPTLPQLTAKPAFSADSVDDERNCIALGNAPADCVPGGDAINQQVQATVISNPELTSEKAKQWSMGVAWDATPSLSLKADVWHTKLEDTIVNVSPQSIVDRDNGDNPLPIPPGLSITRNAAGLITALVRGSTNEGILTQRGVDASILFAPRIGRFGSLRHELRWSRVLKADSNGVDFNGSFNFPKNRASLNNLWRFRAFDAAWNVNMIGKHGEDGSGLNAGTYVTHDVQVGWQTPLKALRLVVGAINVTEKMPKLVGYDARAYSFYLYDGYGRQVYGRLEMKF